MKCRSFLIQKSIFFTQTNSHPAVTDLSQPDTYQRQYNPETGRKDSTLETVIDWRRIRQKYWAAKVRWKRTVVQYF